MSAEELLIEALGGLAGGDAQFVTQGDPECLVDAQGLGDVALCRVGPHEEAMAALA